MVASQNARGGVFEDVARLNLVHSFTPSPLLLTVPFGNSGTNGHVDSSFAGLLLIFGGGSVASPRTHGRTVSTHYVR